jgi:Flp pilus assembly protein TadD
LTFRQSRMYTDIETLYQTTIDGNPTCWMAHNNLGSILARRGQYDKAIAHYQQALELNSNDTQAHNNLGLILVRRGQFDEAIAHYRKALNIEPGNPKFQRNIGVALIARGQPAQAAIHFRKALEGTPNDARLHGYLGLTLAASGQPGEGIAHYREALKINPDSSQIQNNLAWLLATYPEASIRNGAEAVELARQAVQHSDGRQPEILNTLAAAYAEMGRFSEAMETARRSLDLALAQNNTTLADAIRARIKRYQAGFQYYEAPRLPSPSAQP